MSGPIRGAAYLAFASVALVVVAIAYDPDHATASPPEIRDPAVITVNDDPASAGCAGAAWPYLAADCLDAFDGAQPRTEVRVIRAPRSLVGDSPGGLPPSRAGR